MAPVSAIAAGLANKHYAIYGDPSYDQNAYLFFLAKLSAIPWFNSRVRHSMMKTARRAIDKKGKHHD
ncbi:hypothetical protein GJV14_17605 [Enterobacteriaceae bacterium RIT697]|nr:hypothetical protein [Enterobacteriaceae bacterium RIT697]